MDESLWLRFGDAAERAGSDRSAVVRAFILWYLRAPGALPPERPAELPNYDYR